MLPSSVLLDNRLFVFAMLFKFVIVVVVIGRPVALHKIGSLGLLRIVSSVGSSTMLL